MHEPGITDSSHNNILKIVLIYAVFAGLWILLSDAALLRIFDDPEQLAVAETLKGWLFVALTSLLLYFTLRKLAGRHAGSGVPLRHSGLIAWKRWQFYLFAVTVTLLTLLLRQNIAVSFGERPLLVMFMFPIILSAALGGGGPGLVSTLIAALSVTYFVSPTGNFSIGQAHNLLQLGFLVANGLLVSLLSTMLHLAWRRSESERQNAETSLAEKIRTLQLLNAIAAGSTDAIFAKDLQGRYVLFNRAAEQNVGKPASEVLGRDDTAIMKPEDARLVMADDKRIISENKTITWEHTLSMPNGTRVFRTTQGVLRDTDGKVTGVFGIARDITDLKTTETALRQERDRNQRYLDTVQNIMVALDTEGRITMINHYGCSLLGYAADELIGRNWFACCLPSPEGKEIVYPLFRQVMAGQQSAEYFENAVLCRDGSQRMISWHNTLFTDESGKIVGTLSSGEDITERHRVEDALHAQEATYRSLFENMMNSVVHSRVIFEGDKAVDLLYLSVNPAFAEVTGITAPVVGRRVSEIIPGYCEHNPESLEIFGRVAATGVPTRWEHYLTEIGRWLSFMIYSPASGEIIIVSENITERKKAEAQLLKLAQAVEQSPESITITDLDARTEYVNESFVRNSGYSREDLIGQNPRIHQSGKTPKETYDALWKSLTEGRTWDGELYNKRKDSSEYVVHAIISPIRQADGDITHYVSVEEDITDKKRAESEIRRLAYYDTLTDLPNRALLLDRLGMVLPIVQRQQRHDALLVFNLDRFKNVNDTSGQTVGDALLKAVAARLGHVLREGDVLTRLSGDEFAILLLDLAPLEHAAAHQTMHVSEKIHSSLREPFRINEEQIMLTASIGIALFPGEDSDTPLDILRRANSALHQSKAAGGAQTTLFEHSMDENAKQRFRIERELTLGIPAGQLRLYLQPQVDSSGKMVGAEALVRWQHPELGLIPPGVFIPIAEESDLIIEIGRWVFRQVCKLLTHEALLGRTFRIAVNISPRQFRQPDFVAWVRNELAVSGAEPTHLTFEVTESVVIADIGSVIARMNELSVMGIHFAIDDFGTGYSSLAYLKRLPIHELKIDKIFVQDAPSDPDDAALVETILAVAKHMHLKVVAEGVETAAQADFLNARATVIHQGFLFGKPEPMEAWLEDLKQRGA
ncbi:MAG: EAL domain-containing protein [Nitrosomonadales bacterium]|nr:EAL domain-containing protein [Nitrosomonadales bacterium]